MYHNIKTYTAITISPAKTSLGCSGGTFSIERVLSRYIFKFSQERVFERTISSFPGGIYRAVHLQKFSLERVLRRYMFTLLLEKVLGLYLFKCWMERCWGGTFSILAREGFGAVHFQEFSLDRVLRLYIFKFLLERGRYICTFSRVFAGEGVWALYFQKF